MTEPVTARKPSPPKDGHGAVTIVVDDVHVDYHVPSDDAPVKGRASLARRALGQARGHAGHTTVSAVRGISVVAREGEVIGVIGRNGSGKSTLLRTIAGLTVPTRGRVLSDGIPVLLGVSAALLPNLSGRRNVILGGLAMGLRREEVEARFDQVVELADLCSLTTVQLHGDEGPTYCAEVAHRTGSKVIKAARVRDKASVQALRAFRVAGDYHLLDTYAEDAPGGTGRTFRWDLAKERGPGPPLILSGGITPDNVGEAIAAVRPFAVDSASGTESEPGVKDPAKVTALMLAVQQASLAAA